MSTQKFIVCVFKITIFITVISGHKFLYKQIFNFNFKNSRELLTLILSFPGNSPFCLLDYCLTAEQSSSLLFSETTRL